jgi:hypothetical protein
VAAHAPDTAPAAAAISSSKTVVPAVVMPRIRPSTSKEGIVQPCCWHQSWMLTAIRITAMTMATRAKIPTVMPPITRAEVATPATFNPTWSAKRPAAA